MISLSVASRQALQAAANQKVLQTEDFLEGKTAKKRASRKVLHKRASHAIL